MAIIKNVNALSLAKVQAFFLGLMGLVLMIPFFLISLFVLDGQSPFAPFSFLFILLIPLFYAFMGFVMGLVMGWLYNVIAKWVGGIEVTIQ